MIHKKGYLSGSIINDILFLQEFSGRLFQKLFHLLTAQFGSALNLNSRVLLLLQRENSIFL